eukprot:CAMPEP_0119297938 /NCGR_PEP_ID=MMETSP1333-20130426/125_1 /TAXON_ID=418940 /ORGANISM="Scyphosphaera apsteinii, Strain RCC1455" /LENGTH=737 /DNA_ID=CAMNT_0007298905 /DNA_START=55 /DNA_END=2268 /DNA_ORIENTATION=-
MMVLLRFAIASVLPASLHPTPSLLLPSAEDGIAAAFLDLPPMCLCEDGQPMRKVLFGQVPKLSPPPLPPMSWWATSNETNTIFEGVHHLGPGYEFELPSPSPIPQGETYCACPTKYNENDVITGTPNKTFINEARASKTGMKTKPVCVDYTVRGFFTMKRSLSSFSENFPRFLVKRPTTISLCELEQLHQDCVDRINDYRSGRAKFSNFVDDPDVPVRAVQQGSASNQCSSHMALSDLRQNYLGGGGMAGGHWSAFTCPRFGGTATNSCLGRGGGAWNNNKALVTYDLVKTELYNCLQSMWDEGIKPGIKGHWETMKNPMYNFVSCGFAWSTHGRLWMNQDFYQHAPRHPTCRMAQEQCKCAGKQDMASDACCGQCSACTEADPLPGTEMDPLYRPTCPPPPPVPAAPAWPQGSCYFYIVKPCKDPSVRPFTWLRDNWGEINVGSGKDRKVCQNSRPSSYATYCQIPAEMILMHSNPPPVPPAPAPTTPAGSCYFKARKCNNPNETPNKWKRDNWGEEHQGAGLERSVCVNNRRLGYATYCGVGLFDITMHFNPPRAEPPPPSPSPPSAIFVSLQPPPPSPSPPKRSPPPPSPAPPRVEKAPESPPGSCWFKASRCNQPVTSNTWMRDFWGEQNRNSGLLERACTKNRRADTAKWCNVNPEEIMMQWVAPGACFYKVSRCSKPVKLNTWERDSWGETHAKAGQDSNACLYARRTAYAQYCGVLEQEVEMRYDASNPR